MCLSDLHVHISRGVSKLGHAIPSVNLPPGPTCRPDAPCFKLCYARKGRFSFQHNKDLAQRNLQIWQENPERFERDVECAAYTSRFFRWHSSGDIPDAGYLNMMRRVAVKCPETSFLCFTKKFELVNDLISVEGTEILPTNLRIVLSAWGDFAPENPHNFPMAYIDLKGRDCDIPDDARACTGYCGECVLSGYSCWDLKPGESVFFKQH